MVHIRELIDTPSSGRPTRTLPVVLGRNLEGDEVVDDLAKMPHLLIAGATGSGKSVCINAMITSLVYAHPPEKLQLLMIDPKMVELSMYAALPHLGLPVVTSHHKAANVLKWACGRWSGATGCCTPITPATSATSTQGRGEEAPQGTARDACHPGGGSRRSCRSTASTRTGSSLHRADRG